MLTKILNKEVQTTRYDYCRVCGDTVTTTKAKLPQSRIDKLSKMRDVDVCIKGGIVLIESFNQTCDVCLVEATVT